MLASFPVQEQVIGPGVVKMHLDDVVMDAFRCMDAPRCMDALRYMDALN
jgi:hypothetical protein